MSGFEIITFGGGELMQSCLNAVAMVMGASSFQSMALIMALGGVALIGWLFASGQQDIKPALMYIGKLVLISNILITPKATVAIRDTVAVASGIDGSVLIVDNVPVSLALLAQVSSELSYSLTHLMETAFSMPEYARYSETGMMFAARLVNQAGYISITDSLLAENMTQFIDQCIGPDILHDRITMKEVGRAANIWTLFKARVNPARYFLFNDGTQKKLTVCNDGAALKKLDDGMTSEMNALPSKFAAALGLPYRVTKHQLANNMILSYLPGALEFLTGSESVNATNVLSQGIMRHALVEAMLFKGAKHNIASVKESFMHIKSTHENAYHSAESAHSAMEWLPWIQTLFTVMLMALFPIVVLLLFFPGFGSIGKKYVSLFVWLQLWPPITAVVQYCCYHSLQQRGFHWFESQGEMTTSLLGNLQESSMHAVMTAQNMMFAVPAIAGFLVFGSSYMITQALSTSLGGVQGIGGQVANEAATGNIALNNSQINTRAMNTTSGNHFDDNLSVLTGGASIQSASGSMQHYSSDGGFSIQSATANSQIPQQIHLASNLRGSFEKGYQHSAQLAESAMQTYSEAQSAMYHDLMDLGHHYGSSYNADATTTVGDTYSQNDSFTKLHELNQRFAKEQHVSDKQSATILGKAAANLSGSKNLGVGSGLSGNLGVTVDGQSMSTHDKLYQAGEAFVKQHHLTETLDSAKRAVVEDHFRGSDDTGTRLSENISANFEKAESASQQVTTQLEKAARYQTGIQYTQDHAETLDRDLSQPFVEWLSAQPDFFSKVPLGVSRANQIIHRDPALLNDYAQDFVKTLPEHQLLNSINHQLDDKPANIVTDYHASAAAMSGANDVAAADLSNVDTILSDARATEVLNKNVQDNLNDAVVDVQGTVEQGIIDGQTLKNESSVEHKVKREIDKHRGHLGKSAAKEAGKAMLSTVPWVDPYKKLSEKKDEN